MKEDKASWQSFFQWLKSRGLEGVRLVVGDKCLGMLEAVGEVFPEAKYDIADIQTDSRNGGYYTVGKNKQKIAEYIRRQMDEDKLGEQLTMFGKDDDPFKGGR